MSLQISKDSLRTDWDYRVFDDSNDSETNHRNTQSNEFSEPLLRRPLTQDYISEGAYELPPLSSFIEDGLDTDYASLSSSLMRRLKKSIPKSPNKYGSTKNETWQEKFNRHLENLPNMLSDYWSLSQTQAAQNHSQNRLDLQIKMWRSETWDEVFNCFLEDHPEVIFDYWQSTQNQLHEKTRKADPLHSQDETGNVNSKPECEANSMKSDLGPTKFEDKELAKYGTLTEGSIPYDFELTEHEKNQLSDLSKVEDRQNFEIMSHVHKNTENKFQQEERNEIMREKAVPSFKPSNFEALKSNSDTQSSFTAVECFFDDHSSNIPLTGTSKSFCPAVTPLTSTTKSAKVSKPRMTADMSHWDNEPLFNVRYSRYANTKL